MSSVHIPVLLNEVVRGLSEGLVTADRKQPSKWYLDGTFGGGSHALALAGAFNSHLNIIGLDMNEVAIKEGIQLLSGKADKVILRKSNFRDLEKVLDLESIAFIDMVLFDLGISSDELDNSGRGFTFQKDEPLLMTMGKPEDYPFTAKDIVNDWKEDTIANIIYAYGEERFARRIARAIVSYREKKPIATSGELAEIVRSSVPAFYRRRKIHPATKTFQAIRIAVNDELGALKDGLSRGYERLSPQGRMAVISFHSLEDRIVKNFYKEKAVSGGKIITKRPIVASHDEISINPRSRSAKLRVIERCVDPSSLKN